MLHTYNRLSPATVNSTGCFCHLFSIVPVLCLRHGYSCPLPPRENWLPVRIEAGEKAFPNEA
ncbi:MAG: DUF1684 domain-containing protein [Ardenticatenales bacterium]|nr:DUF1684 domain-containing protein [Ardenticatenales bacterium]